MFILKPMFRIAALLLIVVFHCSGQSPSTSAFSTISPAETLKTGIEDSRQRALSLFPDLGKPGSAFFAAVKGKMSELDRNSIYESYRNDPWWPLVVAGMVASDLKVTPRADTQMTEEEFVQREKRSIAKAIKLGVGYWFYDTSTLTATYKDNYHRVYYPDGEWYNKTLVLTYQNQFRVPEWLILLVASYPSSMRFEPLKVSPQESAEAQEQKVESAKSMPQAKIDTAPPSQESQPTKQTPVIVTRAAPEPKGSGSGVIVSTDGYILTAAHVVEGAESVKIVTDGGKLDSKVIVVDAANDIALLKCEGNFAALPFGSSKSIRLGQVVFTLGFPNVEVQGFSPKLTKGEINSTSGFQDDPRQWQISVPVQPGNSGGPLLDEYGNLIGIVVLKLDAVKMAKLTGDIPQSVNYAVKASYARPLLDQFIPDDKFPVATDRSAKFEDVVDRVKKSVVMILVY